MTSKVGRSAASRTTCSATQAGPRSAVYDINLNKRRVALNLDEDVVEALKSFGGRSLSAASDDALRQVVAVQAHRAALTRWLDDLDRLHGHSQNAGDDPPPPSHCRNTALAVRLGR